MSRRFRNVAALGGFVVAAGLTGCAPGGNGSATLRLIVGRPSADASASPRSLTEWFLAAPRSSLADVKNPSSVFGFTCWGVNVMGDGISSSIPQLAFSGFTPVPGTCGYVGETTALVPVPAAGESRTFELQVTPGANRLVQVFGVNTDFGCPSDQSFGGLLTSTIEQEGFDSPSIGALAAIGTAYTDLFSDTEVTIAGAYDPATARANICGIDDGGDSGTLPTSIPGLWGWWTASVIAQADSTAVITWSDSSGLGNSVSNPGSTVSPTFRTNQLNGHPVVDFDGNDFFERAIPAGLPTGDSPFTMMVVMAADVVAVAARSFVAPTAAVYPIMGFGYAAADQGAEFSMDGGGLHVAPFGASPVQTTGSLVPGSWYVVAASYDGGGPTNGYWRLFVNGVEESAAYEDGTGPDFSLSGAIKIGRDLTGSNHFDGRIADAVVYDRALDDAEISALTSAFQSKYGL